MSNGQAKGGGGMPRFGLEELYRRYGAQVYRRALYLLGSEPDAWDATQEVFLKAARALDGFEGRSSPMTWLARITTNHCLNVLRARKVRRHDGLDDLDRSRWADPTAERAAAIRGLLDEFEQETQRVAVHYFVDEMSQEEVAQVVGRSVPTVRKRLREFVAKARRLLEQG